MSTAAEFNQTMVVDAEQLISAVESPATVVAGYVLQERIGVGGYGEVWRAIGPGGLAKAVKILHGNFDGPAADAELKSMELMRELRHPFLLNIERIESDNGRVAIVTELAECSMEDRFEELTRKGQKGIPRDQLLGFLRDAADALDFMHEEHGLQHLDIKPGNLLIQGEHVKVADFGLIKDIRQTNVSMIGGFTPLYAPPELFEGKPNRASDQYSLAILYQVMLTGTPPFGGRTAAQLMAQHLSSKPDLAVLTPSDRSAVARALSKNAAARFPSCREFIDRLTTHRAVKTRTSRSITRSTEDQQSSGPIVRASDEHALPHALPRVEAVPRTPVLQKPSVTTYRPTLFVGIGGLAGQVLLKLQQRLTDHCNQPLPAFALLYIDSDSRAARSVGNAEFGVGLTVIETLSIPLRDAKHYRSSSSDVLDWMSRRWLFNIPRSRQVEGMRSLGRLAFVDHQEQIREQLQKQLAEATSDEAIRATGEHLGVMLGGEKCDVFVIASVSGGTGGGAVLDAGYLIRDVLQSAGIENFNMTGLLLHATGKTYQQGRIQRVNSLSCLTEFQRFSNPHLGFPGAPACRVASSELAPFDSTYLIHLGDQLGDIDFESGTESVAEYLFQRSARPAREFFSRIRAAQNKPPGSLRAEPSLRTFGVARLSDSHRDELASEAIALSQTLLQQWGLGAAVPRESRPSGVPMITELNRDLLEKLGLDVDQLVRKAMSVSQGDIGKQTAEYFADKFNLQSGDASMFANIDEEFARTDADCLPLEHPVAIVLAIRQQLAQTARSSAEQICTQVLSIADQSEMRLATTCHAISDMMHHLEETLNGLAGILRQTDEDRCSLAKQATSAADDSANGGMAAEEMCAAFQNYIARSFCSSVLRCLRGHVNEIRISIRDFGTALMQAVANIPLHDQPEATDHNCQSLVVLFNQQLLKDRSIQLRDLLSEARSATGVPSILMNQALAFLAETGGAAESNDAEPASKSVEDQAQPGLSNVGGGRHVLAVLPQYLSSADWQERLQSRFGNCVTINDQQEDADLFICCEVEDVRLDLVMEQLAEGDPTVTEMASRVHSRIDIDW